MSKKNDRRKGHDFERQIVRDFRKLGLLAYRILEYQVENAQGIDVKVAGLFNVQCKCQQNPSIYKAMKQLPDEQGRWKLVIAKRLHDQTLAIMPYEQFMEILEILKKEGII